MGEWPSYEYYRKVGEGCDHTDLARMDRGYRTERAGAPARSGARTPASTRVPARATAIIRDRGSPRLLG
jgi:hypothetical protein